MQALVLMRQSEQQAQAGRLAAPHADCCPPCAHTQAHARTHHGLSTPPGSTGPWGEAVQPGPGAGRCSEHPPLRLAYSWEGQAHGAQRPFRGTLAALLEPGIPHPRSGWAWACVGSGTLLLPHSTQEAARQVVSAITGRSLVSSSPHLGMPSVTLPRPCLETCSRVCLSWGWFSS